MDEASQWPAFKRMFDLACADPDIRRAVVERRYDDLPQDAFGLDKAAFCEAYHVLRYRGRGAQGDGEPYVSLYRAHYDALKDRLEAVKQPLSPRMARYEQLVSSRMLAQDSLVRLQLDRTYYPAIFELSNGCSIHCDFCALNAGQLAEVFPYTKANVALFSGVLQAVTDLMGEGAAPGGLYFATEPTDNPDYGRFLKLEYAQTGVMPQTTTAAADFRQTRVKALMAQLGDERLQRGAMRFSITSLEQFHRIMAAYSMEELRDVELLPNNPESDAMLSLSGRAATPAFAAKLEACSRPTRVYSISCAAGVVVNFVRKDMVWTEPEKPSKQYPCGLSMRGRTHFTSAEDFREKLACMIDTYALTDIREDSSVSLSPGITLTVADTAATFWGSGLMLRLSGNNDWLQCASMLSENPLPVREIMRRLGIGSFIGAMLRNKLMIAADRGFIRIDRGDGE